ncbi:MAG: glucan 1,3-beta-glucosidase [Betaproteobacteria bacterium]|nr:glucan 1,3-beta-glucosidase [Betaproteobacteria bacterium]
MTVRRLALLLPAAALALLLAWLLTQVLPQPADPPVGAGRGGPGGAAASSRPAGPAAGATRLPCVSYAPFRRPGHTPFDPDLRVSPAQIEADLRLLATVTGCVRTYGVSQGLEAVPAIARRLGLRVLLGAWIGSNPVDDDRELGHAIALAREHADVVDLLLVGNEVLLRGERTPASLAALLDRARREQPVPVAYADVWAYWLRHAEALRGHVDVAAVHVLPYWDDEPVAIEHAVDHVAQTLAAMRAALAPLPVFIAETGWPAAGRQRGPAAPGTLAQNRLVRGLLQAPIDWGWQPGWNLIEGFDQPWKRALEGAMGGYWGVFTAAGERRVIADGPVVPDPAAAWGLLAALAGALSGALLAGRLGAARRPLAIAGGLIAALAQQQIASLAVWSLGPGQTVLGALAAVPALICALLAALPLARAVAAAGPWLDRAHALVLALCLLGVLQLLVDGRYRPLLWPMFGAPAVLMPALWLAGRLPPPRPGVLGGLLRIALAVALVMAALALLWQEGLVNHQAWLAALACLGLALPAVHGAGRQTTS